MNKLQKLLCLLLSLLLLAQAPLAVLAEEPDAAAAEGEVVFPEELIVGPLSGLISLRLMLL